MDRGYGKSISNFVPVDSKDELEEFVDRYQNDTLVDFEITWVDNLVGVDMRDYPVLVDDRFRHEVFGGITSHLTETMVIWSYCDIETQDLPLRWQWHLFPSGHWRRVEPPDPEDLGRFPEDPLPNQSTLSDHL